MKLKQKLIFGFLFVSILSPVGGYVGFSGAHGIFKAYDKITDYSAPAIFALDEMRLSINRMRENIFGLVVVSDEWARAKDAGNEETVREIFEGASEEFFTGFTEAYSSFGLRVKNYETKIIGEGGFADEKWFVEEMKLRGKTLHDIALRLIQAKKEGASAQEILALMNEMLADEALFSKAIDKEFKQEQIEFAMAEQTADSLAERMLFLIIGFSVLVVIVALFVGLFISEKISGPITRLKDAAYQLGQGERVEPIEITSKDEIGDLTRTFNWMNDALRNATMGMILSEKMGAIGMLVSGTAHELNNPMMGILNYIQYCRARTDCEDKRYRILEDAEQEVKRCIEIVKNLLTFSYSEKDSDQNETLESAGVMIDRVLGLLSHRINNENVVVRRSYDKEVSKNLTLPLSLQQVLLNIISNGLDAVRQTKKKEIEIQIHKLDRDMEIIISDTGCGIGKEECRQIFDPFFTTKPVGRGTGLGLSVSRNIVRKYKGNITFESELEKGTTFRISLPL